MRKKIGRTVNESELGLKTKAKYTRTKMFMKQIILFASIFAVICASKEQTNNDGAFVGPNGAVATNHIYGQPIQDNIAAESEVAKRGAAVSSTSTASNTENQAQSSQIDVGTNSASGSNGVLSFGTPNSFQQFFAPSYGQLGGLYAATLVPSSSGSTPQIFYVRAPQQYVAPSGVGTIKLTYTSNSAQPQTSIQYASTTPKVAYTIAPGQYQVAVAATQPNPYPSYQPLAIASPYTTSAYTNTAQLPSASLQQGQIIPYTTASNSIFLNPSQLQSYNFAVPQTVGSSANVQPYTYTTATPILPSVPKIGTTVVSPTAAAYYSASPASQSYQQAPAFLSYQNAALNGYATAQKLVAVPTYTQAAYRPIVSPTAATAASSYTNAFIQPTGSAPVKYTLAQPLNYYNPAASAYQKLAYAPISATSSTPYASPYQQSASQAYATAQVPNTNGAIQYASQLYQPAQYNAAKYGYSAQIPTAQKYFYASS